MTRLNDILLKGGVIYDGTGKPPITGNIAISGNIISYIGADDVEAEVFVDLKGLSVSPGFIDVHAHSDFTVLADPRCEGKVFQGVTTEINGNCGMSAAPLQGQARERREADLMEYGIRERWESLSQYFNLLEKKGIALNQASLVGHGNIRGSVVGYENRHASPSELEEMGSLLKRSLDEGAIGLSTGLIYPPGIYTGTDELITLCRLLDTGSHIYTSHMRSEGDQVEDAIREVISIGRGSEVKVHISHIKTTGEKNWHKADHIVSLLNQARRDGLGITCDRYPYTASSTDLDSLLPAWTYEGGNERELERLANEGTRRRIRNEVLTENDSPEFWEKVIISSVDSENNRWMEGKNLSEISGLQKIEPVECLLNLLLEEKLRVGAIFMLMSEINMRKFLSLPFCMIGSDSSVRSFSGPTRKGKPHPRAFGTFPRFLGRLARDENLFPMEEAIHRSTLLPAKTFGIKNRGMLAPGMYADIVVFDSATIIDNADFDDPFRKPDGIHYVFVNGVPVLRETELTGKLPGKALRRI